MYAVFSGSILRGVFQRHTHAVDYAAEAGVQNFRIEEVAVSMDEASFHAVRVMLHEVESIAKVRYWRGIDATDQRLVK